MDKETKNNKKYIILLVIIIILVVLIVNWLKTDKTISIQNIEEIGKDELVNIGLNVNTILDDDLLTVHNDLKIGNKDICVYTYNGINSKEDAESDVQAFINEYNSDKEYADLKYKVKEVKDNNELYLYRIADNYNSNYRIYFKKDYFDYPYFKRYSNPKEIEKFGNILTIGGGEYDMLIESTVKEHLDYYTYTVYYIDYSLVDKWFFTNLFPDIKGLSLYKSSFNVDKKTGEVSFSEFSTRRLFDNNIWGRELIKKVELTKKESLLMNKKNLSSMIQGNK